MSDPRRGRWVMAGREPVEGIVVHCNHEKDKPGRATTWLAVLSLLLSCLALASTTSVQTVLDDFWTNKLPNRLDRPLPASAITVSSSSFRQDPDADLFTPADLVDGKLDTAWSECRPDRRPGEDVAGRSSACTEPPTARRQDCEDPTGGGDEVQGIGEWVELSFSEPVVLKRLRLWNGLQSSDALFLRNPRIKELRVDLGGDQPSQQWALMDVPYGQTLTLPSPVEATRLRFTIAATYPGECILGDDGRTLRPYFDTSVSELQVIPEGLPRTS